MRLACAHSWSPVVQGLKKFGSHISSRSPSSSSRNESVALCTPKMLSRPTIVAAINDDVSDLGEAALEAAGSADAEVV